MGGNVCEVCREGTTTTVIHGRVTAGVPLCLYTVERMSGQVSDPLVLCPNCAERIYRRSEVFRVDREGEVR